MVVGKIGISGCNPESARSDITIFITISGVLAPVLYFPGVSSIILIMVRISTVLAWFLMNGSWLVASRRGPGW
jgi:hypothetical protein